MSVPVSQLSPIPVRTHLVIGALQTLHGERSHGLVGKSWAQQLESIVHANLLSPQWQKLLDGLLRLDLVGPGDAFEEFSQRPRRAEE